MKNYERFVSQEEIEKIHNYSLRILSEVGMNFEHEEALEVFRKHGARVEGQTVFIDEKMINDVLKLARPSFTVKSCKGDLEIGSGKQYNGAIGGNVYCHHPDGKIRKMNNEETLNQFKLEDTSDVLDFATINYFQDYSKGFTLDQKVFSNIALILKYAHKPLFLTTANTFALSDKHAIKEAFERSVQLLNDFEGNDAIHNVYILNTLSPLTMDHDPLDRVFVLCEANQGIMFAPCAMPLMTAPPSVASMVAMTNAEVLGGYTLAKLINPDVPVVYGNTSGATDMRTVQLAIGAPECALVVYATAGLADRYGLPFRTGGSLSDAKDADIQAGAESMMMITATQDAGADIVLHACGCMGSFNVTDFRKFVI
ncbi:MAG: trimethylamine methyltransferase family protein, partial [Eubacterium sp.]